MKICTLYSGSRGNAIFISAGGKNILFDAGKSSLKLCSALTEIGFSPADIDAVFITHEHSDHTSALETFLKKHKIPVHMVSASANKLLSLGLDHLNDNIVCHPLLYSVDLGGVTVSSFEAPHDSNSCVGYRITFFRDGQKCEMGIATDMGYVSESVLTGLLGCESVIIEANHDIEMLKYGRYPADLKKRILSKRGHLSNEDCAILVSRLTLSGTKNILLAHLSEENNTPDTAYDEIAGVIANMDVRLAVADPVYITKLIWE